ncbi:MAG: hypothetical protein JSS82_15620 [Bacteroidetes bacterium]|nr:hypothetical protein [Bacteroidota bacterium]
MTTIAWDGVEVAADSQCSQGGQKWFGEKKLFKFDDVVASYAGREDYGTNFLIWVRDGMQTEDFPTFPAKDDAFDLIGLVFQNGKAFEFCDNGTAAERKPPFAWGSGSGIAKGAMAAGRSPREAVKIATKHDLYTGGAVRSMIVGEPKKRAKKKVR